MDARMIDTINEKIGRIHEFSKYSLSDRIVMEKLVNCSYQIMNTVIKYMNSLPENANMDDQEFLDLVNILRHVYNLSCCMLHIGYAKGDPLVFGSFTSQVKHIDNFVNKGDKIPDEVLGVYDSTIDKDLTKTLDGKINFATALFNDIERRFRSSKCLIYDGKLSDISDYGWGDIVDYFNRSREDDAKIFELNDFKDMIKVCQKQLTGQDVDEK